MVTAWVKVESKVKVTEGVKDKDRRRPLSFGFSHLLPAYVSSPKAKGEYNCGCFSTVDERNRDNYGPVCGETGAFVRHYFCLS